MGGMVNVGAWPVDPGTEVGFFRTELGDVIGVPHVPADNSADFQFLSDEAIGALILAYPSSRNMAMSRAMTSMATQMIAAAQDIQVDDIRIKTVERANLMLTLATTLYNGSIMAEASSGFGIVGLNAATDFSRNPQGTPAGELFVRGSRAYGSSGF